MRKWIVFFIFVFCGDATFGATCSPGYYPNGDTCTICPQYYACPDGTSIISCSERSPGQYTEGPGATECINCPTDVNETDGFAYIYHYRPHKTNPILGCRAQWFRQTAHGTMYLSCHYSDGSYDRTIATSKCMLTVTSCDAGYISVSPWVEVSNAYRSWWDSYDTVPTDVCRPVGIGNYSADGELDATSCPTGMSTHTDTAASVADCAILCHGDVNTLHIGQYVYNLWQDKTSTPSLNVRVPNGDVCYVNMAPEPGDVNIRIDNTIFHISN